MEDLPFQIVFWHWWSLAFVLLILELLASGTYFLWMAIAAGVVGLITLVFPAFPLEMQLLLLGTLSVVSILVWLRYDKNNPTRSDQPTLNKRGRQYIGRTFTLDEAIINGYGKIRVDDSTWKVSGSDAPMGGKVRVMDMDGTVLQVEIVE